MICDTDAFATALWHERYLGDPSPAVDAVAATHRPDLYILTDIDIPFVQDGTRDGEHIRTWMHHRFIEELTARERPYIVVSGSHAARLRAATAAIDRVLTRPGGYAATEGRRDARSSATNTRPINAP